MFFEDYSGYFFNSLEQYGGVWTDSKSWRIAYAKTLWFYGGKYKQLYFKVVRTSKFKAVIFTACGDTFNYARNFATKPQYIIYL